MTEALDWLAEHLTGTGERPRPSPVHIFVTGASEWRHLQTWPPPTEERVLYLQPHGGLSESVPPSHNSPTGFTYDPADPTPAVGGRVINPTIGGHRHNRKLEERADVLTFTSAPLIEPLEVMGSPLVELAYETDNPHADFFVRLCEVGTDGRSINVSDGFTRLEAGRPRGSTQLRLDAIAHRFNRGVRIRLQVSGGAHPRYARNLGTNEDPSTGTQMAPSRRVIFHGDGGLSRVNLPCRSTGQRQRRVG
jgi:putative CocE/NonD family hydrolase